MNRRDENHTVKDIIENLKFVDSLKIKMPGRCPKIESELQIEIVEKIFSFNKKISDFADEKGTPFYYRTAGGEYFNVVTDYSSGSSQEKPFFTQKKFTKIIAATLSTNLFWFYQQVYSDRKFVLGIFGGHRKKSWNPNFVGKIFVQRDDF